MTGRVPINDTRDQGHAWFILFTSIVCNMFWHVIILTPSLFMVSLTEAFDLSTYQSSWIVSVNAFLATTGVAVGGILIERFSCKTVGFVGGFFTCLTLIWASLSTNVIILVVTLSVLTGAVFSLTRMPPIVIIQMYFNEKRPLATGISLVGYSLGSIFLLPVIAYCIEYYGWRGAMMLVAGLSLNMCVCMLTFTSVNPPHNTDVSTIVDSKTLTDNGKKSAFDCSMLTDSTFLLAGFSWALFQFGTDMMFKVAAPRAELDIGVDKVQASVLISAISVGGLFSRIISSVLANIACVSTLAMYAFSILFGGVVIGVLAFVEDYTVTLIGTGVYGMLFGMAHTVQTTVLVDLLGVETIARTQGFIFGITGIMFLLNVPLAGWMYDTFSSFTFAYLTAAIIQCAGGLLALVLLLRSRRAGLDPERQTEIMQKPRIRTLSDRLSPVLTGSIHSIVSSH